MNYRIAWRSKLTGATGHGNYMPEDLATAWIETATRHFGDILDHWLKPEGA